MHMTLKIVLSLVIAPLCLLCAGPASAAYWQTPDGNILIALPDPQRFVEDHQFTPPIVNAWRTEDNSLILSVMRMDNLSNAHLKKDGLERGICKELNGSITSSEETSLNGVAVFKIAAKGKANDRDVWVAEEILTFSGSAYKLVAFSFKPDVLADQDVRAMMDSLQILKPPAPSQEKPTDSREEFYGKIGAWGAGLLILALIVAIARRKPRSTNSA